MPRQRGRRGAGTITPRTVGPKGRKRTVYQAQWSRTEGGKRIRLSLTFAIRSDAEWWLRQAARTGVAPDTGQTVGEYLEAWLETRRSIAPSTRLSYENHVRQHIVPVIGDLPVAKLLPRHVEALIADRLAHVAESTHRPLTPSTVRSIVTTLRMALAQGVRRRELPDNAAADVQAPRVRREPVRALTVEDAGRLVAAVRGTWLEQLVRFLLGSGVRIGEAVALNQGDVKDGFVQLRKSKTTLRAVPISSDAMAALSEAIAAAPRRGAGEPVFFGPRRTEFGVRDRLDRASVQHALPRILVDAGLPRLTPHMLRHGVATLMLTGGASMRTIADQLGHANPAMTARIYAHVDPSLRRRALDTLDEAVRSR